MRSPFPYSLLKRCLIKLLPFYIDGYLWRCVFNETTSLDAYLIITVHTCSSIENMKKKKFPQLDLVLKLLTAGAARVQGGGATQLGGGAAAVEQSSQSDKIEG